MIERYDSGLFVGRLQGLHKGHEHVINIGLNLCERLYVFLGSAQENGTERNPFNIATRIDMLRTVFPDQNRVIIYALQDLTNENDITYDWGKYVIDNCNRYIGKLPELMIYGNDDSRSKWFHPEDIKDTMEIIVPRSKIAISGTEVRDDLIADNKVEWMRKVPSRIHGKYQNYRSELMGVSYYLERVK